MIGPQINIPNTGKRKIRAFMRIKSFLSPASPTEKTLAEYEKTMNAFLETIDNETRILNGRNVFQVDKSIYTLVWYLEVIPDEPVTTPFGEGKKEEVKKEDVKPDIKTEKKKN